MSTLDLDFDLVAQTLTAVLGIEVAIVGPQVASIFWLSHARSRRATALAAFNSGPLRTLFAALPDAARRSAWIDAARGADLDVVRDGLLDYLGSATGALRDAVAFVYRALGLTLIDLAALRALRASQRLIALRRLTLVALVEDAETVRAFLPRSWTEQVLVAQILARIGRAEDVAERLHAWALVTRLHEHAVKAVVGAMPLPEFARLMQSWFTFSSPGVRRDLLVQAAARAPHLAEAALNAARFDPSVEVRVGLCQALAYLPRAEAAPQLVRLCHDAAWEVRAQATKSLGRIADVARLPELVRGLSDPSFWVRQNAAVALTRLGESGRAALEAVTELSDDRYALAAARAALAGLRLHTRAVATPRLG